MQVIDLRSFSSVWYWMVVAVVWSSVSHFVLGVPYDLVQRAKRYGDQALSDLEDVVRVNVNRLIHIGETAGLFLATFITFLLTGLLVLGFFYWIEFAQAIFLLAFPLTLVAIVTLSTARKISVSAPKGEDLFGVLHRLRLITQSIGMCALFVTAMFGMYENLNVARHLIQ